MLIGEYEATLGQKTKDREAAEQRAREANDKYKRAKEKLEQDIVTGMCFSKLRKEIHNFGH